VCLSVLKWVKSVCGVSVCERERESGWVKSVWCVCVLHEIDSWCREIVGVCACLFMWAKSVDGVCALCCVCVCGVYVVCGVCLSG
jgi:hypothetical protein